MYPQLSAFKNNADNSIKIVFTDSELRKYKSALILRVPIKKKKPRKDGWACRKTVTFDRTLEIIRNILELRSQIPKSGPDADIMRIIAALKKCGLFWSPFFFTTK